MSLSNFTPWTMRALSFSMVTALVVNVPGSDTELNQALEKAGRVADFLEMAELLVTDALHCQPEHARPLAQLVHEKTSGNPFFAIQFLTTLAEDGLLSFDPAVPAWQWDIDRIRARNYTDNVVEFMTAKLKRLNPFA